MFTPADLGKEVKVVMINAERVRGIVKYVNPSDGIVEIDTGRGVVPVAFNKISTRTDVGDFSS